MRKLNKSYLYVDLSVCRTLALRLQSVTDKLNATISLRVINRIDPIEFKLQINVKKTVTNMCKLA